MSATVKPLDEGKTKIIWPTDSPNRVRIESKPDITAGDGAKRDVIEGKAEAANATTCNVFELLEAAGIWTHYVDRVDDRSFLAMKAEMIPIELVARRVATGSYLKRNPNAVEGEIFDKLVFEMFWKDDDLNDPFIVVDEIECKLVLYPAGAPIETSQPIKEIPFPKVDFKNQNPFWILKRLERMTRRTFETIEAAWAEQDVLFVDLKIECGWVNDPGEDGLDLAVADVIDNDSWRIWPAGDQTRMLDKQVYRELAESDDPKTHAKSLGKIKDNYDEVAEKTGRFVSAD